jgi:hypothetical protein
VRSAKLHVEALLRERARAREKEKERERETVLNVIVATNLKY